MTKAQQLLDILDELIHSEASDGVLLECYGIDITLTEDNTGESLAPLDKALAEYAQSILHPPIQHFKRTGDHCSVEGCGLPQFRTPSGSCCVNGHGGAPPLDTPT